LELDRLYRQQAAELTAFKFDNLPPVPAEFLGACQSRGAKMDDEEQIRLVNTVRIDTLKTLLDESSHEDVTPTEDDDNFPARVVRFGHHGRIIVMWLSGTLCDDVAARTEAHEWRLLKRYCECKEREAAARARRRNRRQRPPKSI